MSTAALHLQPDHVDAQPARLLAEVIGFFFSSRILSTVLSVRMLQQDMRTGAVLSLAFNFLLLGAFVAGETVLLVLDRSTSRTAKAMLILATGFVVAAFWGVLTTYYDIYMNSGNGAETLTRRFGIWAIILDRAVEQPWFGHGFHFVWSDTPFRSGPV
jgi:O-antigen ligase